MLRGYEAVDSLIQECSKLGREVAAGIKKWGVDVSSANNELEITNVEHSSDDEEAIISRNRNGYFTDKPKLFAEDLELKDYQQVGVNWLALLYKKGLSCILADEMGLGKTCQVIAFLAHLKEIGKKGPHLVVVPASTLENWLREFNRFCPSMIIEPYYGSMEERANIRDTILDSNNEYDVMVTTYNLACGGKLDHSFLRSQRFNVCVYDEGHLLKNSQSERYSKLMKLKAKFRLLLTGTPLQNNLRELVSLLSFILPDLFQSRKEELAEIFKHKAKTNTKGDSEGADNAASLLLSEERINKAKAMMTPFVLRRKKDQVLSYLPDKNHTIEFCDLSKEQEAIYNAELEKSREAIAARELAKETGEPAKIKNLGNVLMRLRKAALHPLLFREVFTDATLKVMAKEIMKEERYREASEKFIYEDMEVMNDYELHGLCESFPQTIGYHKLSEDRWMTSGKVKRLETLLPTMKKDGDRVLLFSQFTQILDILEKVLNRMKISFLRLDGSTPVEIRQEMIDRFYEEEEITVFLLSTKAGGFGINLACANVVIIFDLSFNPHDDKQAEDRAHRVGQTREVRVIRMVTRETIEENILELANTKLKLDKSVSNEDEEKYEQNNMSMVASMLLGRREDTLVSEGTSEREGTETETREGTEATEGTETREGSEALESNR